jgi:hypothetical protein
MTAAQVAGVALSWLALVAAVVAVLSPQVSRWLWSGACLLFAAWLALIAPPGLAAALAVGSLIAVLSEREDEPAGPDFALVTRRLSLLVAGLLAAVVLMVRVAQVEPGDAPYVFPPLAAGIVALIALVAATEQAEIQRAARLLLVLAAVGWTVATAGSEPAAVIVAALALPLLALSGKLNPSTEPGNPVGSKLG